jgi:hypothetical protein
MFMKSAAMAAALATAAVPTLANAQAMEPSSASALSLQSDSGGSSDEGGIFASPGSGIGIALFITVIVLGVLTATGTLFDDDTPRSY